MPNTQLRQWLKSHGYTLQDTAEHTGYSYGHVVELLNGTTPFTDNARVRFAQAFPETTSFLLPQLAANSNGGNGNCDESQDSPYLAPAGRWMHGRYARLISTGTTDPTAWTQTENSYPPTQDPFDHLVLALVHASHTDVALLILALLARARASDAHLDRVRTVLSAYLAGQVLADEVAGALLPLLGAA